MSSGVAVNSDGAVVVFFSDARLLVSDTNGKRDVYLYDRGSGVMELVSVGDDGRPANRPSQASAGAPAVSADGEKVVFYSDATNLVGDDTNGARDVFVRNRAAGTTERVSVNDSEEEADGPSVHPSISADGRYVAFQSNATNLVPDDTNGVADVFVRDLVDGTTERVCGVQGNDFSMTPRISADGNVVVFVSAATDLVDGDDNDRLDVFACDRSAGMIELVSLDGAGLQGDGDSILPDLSADGSIVAFKSTATNLVPNDLNRVVDVFARDRVAGTTERISVDMNGGDGGDSSFPPSVSDDGRFIAFASMAADLIELDVNQAADVFVRDRQIGVTMLASDTGAGAQANGGTPDIPPAISRDAKFVGFVSLASNLAGNDRNGLADVFITQTPFFREGMCPRGDEDCPPGQVCVDGVCVEATPTPEMTDTPTITPTPVPTNTPTTTPTFRPCETDEDCAEDEVCRGGYCRKKRPCDDEDPILDRIECFEREACIDNLCECGGDCNLDGYVFTNEITRAVLILAGVRELDQCAAADLNGDGDVMGNEITLGVINLGDGCLQEGRPLLFAHDRLETVTLSIQSETSADGSTATVSVHLSGGLGEVATVQLDMLFDPQALEIDDPALECVKDERLGSQVVVASLPNSPAAPEGLDRLRLFVGSIATPVQAFEDGHVATCTFRMRMDAGTQSAVAPDRLNVGDASGNTFQVQAFDGSVALPIPTPTPLPAPAPPCAGDCDGDGEVLGNEITQAVLIMAGEQDLDECPPADADGDGEVWVTDVSRAVINLGLGCPQ